MDDIAPLTDSTEEKPVGIRDIAQVLGISIGTVDRALHNRRGVSPITRQKVMNVAQSLGYRPNLAARYLSSRKELLIGVILPREVASFFDSVRSGIRDAAAPFVSTGIRVNFYSNPVLGEGEAQEFEAAMADGVQGLIIAPGCPDKLSRLIRKASRAGVPVMCVSTDAPHTERLGVVSVDPYVNGSIVGELMGGFSQGSGDVVVVTGLLSAADHAQKLRGFSESIASLYPGMNLVSTVEAHDDNREAYDKCRQVLARYPDIRGVYVSTANSLPVLRAIDESGVGSKVITITTDLFPDLVPMIRCGKIRATIHQRPFNQGRIAFETLRRFLVDGECHAPLIRLAPHIVLRGNLNLFVERMERERVPGAALAHSHASLQRRTASAATGEM